MTHFFRGSTIARKTDFSVHDSLNGNRKDNSFLSIRGLPVEEVVHPAEFGNLAARNILVEIAEACWKEPDACTGASDSHRIRYRSQILGASMVHSPNERGGIVDYIARDRLTGRSDGVSRQAEKAKLVAILGERRQVYDQVVYSTDPHPDLSIP